MAKSRKAPTERGSSDPSSNDNEKLVVENGSEAVVSAAKGKRGRPKGSGGGVGPKPKPEPKTKMIDGKLMKRAIGVPKKVKTGKRGRPRKEYIWVEAK